MLKGTIKFFNNDKGYCFIVPADGSKDVFFHISVCKRGRMEDPVEDEKVQYETEQKDGKLSATIVQR